MTTLQQAATQRALVLQLAAREHGVAVAVGVRAQRLRMRRYPGLAEEHGAHGGVLQRRAGAGWPAGGAGLAATFDLMEQRRKMGAVLAKITPRAA